MNKFIVYSIIILGSALEAKAVINLVRSVRIVEISMLLVTDFGLALTTFA